MNRIDVKVGDMVKKNQSLGVAGATGLAGGVHVHFSMQIDGVQVNPREWWDEPLDPRSHHEQAGSESGAGEDRAESGNRRHQPAAGKGSRAAAKVSIGRRINANERGEEFCVIGVHRR